MLPVILAAWLFPTSGPVAPGWSEHAGGHALDLRDRGEAVAHLLQAVVAQAHHALLEGDRDHVVDRCAFEDQRADALADGHHLIHAQAPAIAGAAAARAADRLVGVRARDAQESGRVSW